MDRWREYFESAGVDLWTICERALTVAYIDNPDDFPSQRDKLAQKLYAPEKLEFELDIEQAPQVTKRNGAVHQDDDGDEGDDRSDRIRRSSDSEDDDGRLQTPPNGIYDEAEALTDEMEEENLLKRDVFEIKDSILDSYKSEREIFDSLQRLQLMQLTFDVLKETEIGKTVNNLRKHSSARIRNLVRKLVSEWKETAEHWYKCVEDVTAAARDGPVSVDSPLDDEEDGLPSPPMDEGALLAGRTASLEMSQLFDFMDEDTPAGSGNPSNKPVSKSGSAKKSNGYVDAERQDSSGKKKTDSDLRKKDRDSVTSSNATSRKEKESQAVASDSRRLSHEKVEKKVQRPENSQRQTLSGQTQKIQAKTQMDLAELDQQRLLAAKKKLQENYQQVENAKRQRTIQVMELEELPKGGPKRAKAPQMLRGKPGSQQRPQAFGRR